MRLYRLAKLRRWRWDAVHYRPVEGQFPVVLDSRQHLTADPGHTFTWLGAAIAAPRTLGITPTQDGPKWLVFPSCG